MIIEDVMDDIGNQLDEIPDLRVVPYEADSISPPAGLVTLPTNIDYLSTYNRGSDKLTLNVLILVGQVGARIRRNQIAPYGDGAGPKSVKVCLEGGKYNSFDTIAVSNGQYTTIPIARVRYLGLRFVVNITGQGK